MRFFVLAVFGFLFFSNSLIAKAEHLATIEKTEGSVKILKSGSIIKANAQVGTKLYQNDIILTSEKSKASIKLINNTAVVLSEQSKVEIKNIESFSQTAGKALYSVQKNNAKNGTKVSTDFATIGVKGTEFIVASTAEDKRVSLKNGLVELQSLKGEFEIHRKKDAQEYADYLQSLGKEYTQYEKKLQEEYIEYKKSFELKPNLTINFISNKAFENKIDKKIEQEFEELESFK
jgi:hypothetical protein